MKREFLNYTCFKIAVKEYLVFMLNILIAINIFNYLIPRRALLGNIFVSVEVKLIKHLNFLCKYAVIFVVFPVIIINHSIILCSHCALKMPLWLSNIEDLKNKPFISLSCFPNWLGRNGTNVDHLPIPKHKV